MCAWGVNEFVRVAVARHTPNSASTWRPRRAAARRQAAVTARRHVGPIAYERRASGPFFAAPSRRILSPRFAALDRSMAVILSFETRIHPLPVRRFERLADESTQFPSRRD